MRWFVRWRLLVALMIATIAVPASIGTVVPASAVTAARAVHFTDARGLHVVGVRRLGQRSYDVMVLSENLGRPVHVRILLPPHYLQHPRTRYPALYLFHGTSGWASDWEVNGDAEKTLGPHDVITVMPDCGFDGDGGFWFTNWVNRMTSHGPSQFESYLIDQLVPWVDANLRTIAARRGRAVAGLSQGGYGSAEMAARHPDMFAVMASFSGAPEIDRDHEVIAGATAVISAIEFGLDHVPPGSMLGSRATDEINWQGHDPSTLLTNLRGMGIYLWTGAGAPGPYDSTPPNPGGAAIEALVHQSTLRFHQHLIEAGIPSYYDDYTYGTHDWHYWARDLRAFVKPMMATFAHPTTPRTTSYMSIDRHWQQWGWSVSLTRSVAQEFSSLDHATARGFVLTGSGRALVVTPQNYRPGERLRVSVTDNGGTTTHLVSADRAGRVHLTLSLSSTSRPGSAAVTVRSA